jgi:exosortase A
MLQPLVQGVAWRRLLPGLLLIAAVLVLFRDTATAMVGIWMRSDTFAHAFLVPPISIWLVWRRRQELARLTPQPSPSALLPMVLACLAWLLGQMVGANSLTQFALVALLVLSVPAVFGWAVARELSFPLLFLFFAVPIGDFLVPTMMQWTADFAVAAIRLSGIPIYREGLQFVIPSGNWSVVEACSGVRYLIASFMVGTLFGYLNFHSPRRRALFMAVSVIVPLLANWVRAYLIVLIGHLSGNKLATGVDHIIYGWVFFGVVIGLMFMIGGRFADAPPQSVPAAGPAAGRVTVSTPRPGLLWAVGLAMLLMLAATQWLMNRAVDGEHQGAVAAIALPDTLPDGWQAAATPVSDWVPGFSGGRSSASRSYERGEQRAAIWISFYRQQGYDRKMITSTNGMAEPGEQATWVTLAKSIRTLDLGGQAVDVRAADLRGSAQPGDSQAQRLRGWQLYWIDGRFVSGDLRARWQLALNRLLGRGDDAAVIVLYADSTGPGDADSVLQGLAVAALPVVSAALQSVSAAR